MARVLKIGIAGLGNVGADVVRLLSDHAGLLELRAQKQLKITAVSARERSKDRGLSLGGITWHNDPVALALDPEVDVVVELIGGADGPALGVVKTALLQGKPVVTANKALLASRGGEILSLLGNSKSTISFEAAVAGGVPVIKGLREGLSANAVRAVYGILNGTCNFILSEMRTSGRDFGAVLREAQDLGYAEADPSFDVDGMDSAHKLSILSGLAFGTVPDVASIEVKGIRNVSALDISFADELGYRIKLLGIARMTDNGVEQSVEPCLVPRDVPIAAVEGPLNAVYIDGDYSGKILLTGAGAGGRATASAVVSDIIDIARGHAMPLMGVSANDLSKTNPANIHDRIGSYYLRLVVLDQPGVIADVSAILRDCNVSLESVLQRGHNPGQPVQVILTTHETTEKSIRESTALISKLKSVSEPPHVLRIEEFS